MKAKWYTVEWWKPEWRLDNTYASIIKLVALLPGTWYNYIMCAFRASACPQCIQLNESEVREIGVKPDMIYLIAQIVDV